MTRVLSLNCGSSSLKYAVFDVEDGAEHEVLRGGVERIGEEVPDHAAAVSKVLDELRGRGVEPVDVVGHRIVHGAERSAPALVDDALLASLERLVRFAPLHLPAEIRAVRAVGQRWPNRPQVVCFDTAFHRTLSEAAERYPLPQRIADDGVRRYGFHGLSYEYIVGHLGARTLGRAVLAHLGAGASMTAVRDGRSVDTTMGFTPSGGLVMASRPGDLDPGVLLHLLEQGYDAKSLAELVNRQAGLRAISGTTGDVRELLSLRDHDPRAALALDVFVWTARKWIGALAATLGGIESLVFSGGIGEHAVPVRAAIAQGLEHLGIRLDEERNARGADVISAEESPCRVWVVRTDEERILARQARRVLLSGPRPAT